MNWFTDKELLDGESPWIFIRANWVNGNIKDTKQKVSELTTKQQALLVIQAIEKHLALLPAGTVRSGDLTDLLEILVSTLN